MSLQIVPCTLKQANTFIAQFHRHHRPLGLGGLYAVAVADDSRVVGVALVGRTTTQIFDDGYTAEVRRLCTDGTPNACSMLYGAAARAAKALGYRCLITYTLPAEGGASLKASGWVRVAETRERTWNSTTRMRQDRHPVCPKWRWEIRFPGSTAPALWPEVEQAPRLFA